MRDLADASRVRRFMHELGRGATKPASVYFTGGASAVLLGWRKTTIDLDLKIVSDDEDLLKPIPRLKDELQINVELAALRELFEAIEMELYRYPAVDPKAFRAGLQAVL